MIKNDFNNYSPAEFITVITEQESVITEQKNQIDNLKHQVSIFQNMVFGSKQEQHKAIENPEQTSIEFAEKVDLDLPQDIEEQKTSFHRKKTNTKRTDYSKLGIPADLERIVTVIEPLDKTDDMVKIGEEVTELLAITPQKFFVKKIIRPKYAKANKEGIVIAALPSRPLQGGIVDVSLLTMLLLDKYVDHMPIRVNLVHNPFKNKRLLFL